MGQNTLSVNIQFTIEKNLPFIINWNDRNLPFFIAAPQDVTAAHSKTNIPSKYVTHNQTFLLETISWFLGSRPK